MNCNQPAPESERRESERLADLELLLRWFLAEHTGWDPARCSESGQWELHDGRRGTVTLVPDDGSGLPDTSKLTDELRAALRAAPESVKVKEETDAE